MRSCPGGRHGCAGGASWGEVPDANGKIFAFHRAAPHRRAGCVGNSSQDVRRQDVRLAARYPRRSLRRALDHRRPQRNGTGEQVFKFSPDGQLLVTLGTKGTRGDGPNTFGGPCDVAVAENGDIFVADGHFNAGIVKFA